MRVRRVSVVAVAGSALALTMLPAAAGVAAPAPLSADHARPNISSTKGSGAFGGWAVDRYGLPAYDYTVDELKVPQAAQPELDGSRDNWSQLGNDHIVANAYNHGYTTLWSLDRLYQQANAYDASTDHFAGGYGYLNAGGTKFSTLYDDRPKGATSTRRFGVDYFEKGTSDHGLSVDETDYAPFGDDPVLLDDVTVTNHTRKAISGKWFEYWDVNPETQAVTGIPRGVGVPSYDASTRTLSVTQDPDGQDVNPLSIFASALGTPVSGYDTDTSAFFGSGTRAMPQAVAAGHTSNSTAPPSVDGHSGSTLFVLQSPVILRPGATVTLHYAYGLAAPSQIAPLVTRSAARASSALLTTENDWRNWLPTFDFGASYAWLSRELEWDAYMLRSGETYDAGCGYHVITQGGYYTFGDGVNIAYRDPLQYAAAIAPADPGVAADIIRYSAHEQPQGSGAVPYGIAPMCQRFDLGTSDDLDLYLMWATVRYVESTRDVGLLSEKIPYFDGTGTGTIWQHLQLAFFHQENVIGRGAHGEYIVGSTGDWSDFSTAFLQMTESDLVTAQAAYIYPQLADLAARSGQPGFATQLRSAAARDAAVVKGQYVTGGWFARGYSGTRQIGKGAIFEEPQSWALLAGLATPQQAARTVAAYRRFLVGVDAPKAIHGPSKIGASLTPASNDPDVTERSEPPIGSNSSNYVAGAWYSPNGWMTWALGALAGTVHGAAADAWDEMLRNTLTAHADAFPDSWDGLLSVDDVCASFFAATPGTCGNGLSTTYDSQIYHQDAWSLFDAAQLTGVTPTATGFDIDPVLPVRTFSMKQATIGLAAQPGLLRGYLRPLGGGTVTLSVTVADPVHLHAFVNGAGAPFTLAGHIVTLRLRTAAGHATDWAITTGGAAGNRTASALPVTGGALPLAILGFALLTLAGIGRQLRSQICARAARSPWAGSTPRRSPR